MTESESETEMEMNTKTPDNNSINLPSPVWHIQQVMQANGFPRGGGRGSEAKAMTIKF